MILLKIWNNHKKLSLNYMRNSCICRNFFDRAGKEQEVKRLEEASLAPDLWSDPEKASVLLKKLESLRSEVAEFDRLGLTIQSLEELWPIAETPEEQADLEHQLEDVIKEIDTLEFQTFLGGQYDRGDALVSIHSGAGGVDAQDWTEMLLRMYLRFAEQHGFAAKVLDESRGGEAGIKSVTFELAGPYAYGWMRSEAGVHRLVRLSPFNADQLRQTSFAMVEVLPVIEDAKEIEIRSEDLRVDTYRASGAGGQHVNKTESAIRITHNPTGIVVSCQSERSQIQNRDQAMKMLLARLWERRLTEQAEQKKELKGEHKSMGWGNQIRSYVLHPYTMVKDHRTKHETSNTTRVLDGDIKDFMETYFKSSVE